MGISLEQLTNSVNKVMTKVKDKFVSKEEGKGLSTNDYSTEDKSKVAKIDDIENSVKNVSSQIDEKANLLNARIDTFTKLEEGSTTGDAELIDIRIGVDGTTYENAGEAVRNQVTNLKGDLDTLNEGGLILKEDFIGTQVNEWLDEHPEATTTVQDESLEISKFTDNAKLYVIKDYVTPQMFGAKGDGVTDDYSAIQSLLDNNKYPKIFIPIGRYKISKGLVINRNVEIIGDTRQFGYYGVDTTADANGSVILFDGVSNDTMITISRGKVSISNISLVGNSYKYDLSRKTVDNYTNHTIFTENIINEDINGIVCNSGVLGCWLKDLRITGFSGYGVRLGQFSHLSGGFYNNCNKAIYLDRNDCTVFDIRIGASKVGIYANYSSLNSISKIRCDDIAEYPIELIHSDCNHISDIINDHSNYGALHLISCSNNTIDIHCGRCCEYYGGCELTDIDDISKCSTVFLDGDCNFNSIQMHISNTNVSDNLTIKPCYIAIGFGNGSYSRTNVFTVLGNIIDDSYLGLEPLTTEQFPKLLSVKHNTINFEINFANHKYMCISYNGSNVSYVNCDGFKMGFWNGIRANYIGEMANTSSGIKLWNGTSWITLQTS